MDWITEPCPCLLPMQDSGETSIDILAATRKVCPALHAVFLPDSVWPDFQNWHIQSDKVAFHSSVLLLALERGHLSRVTSPIHRYLVHSGSVRPEVRQQYLKDLRERWMLYADPIERHRKSRIFRSRVAELQFAEWLETRAGAVTGLEALREGPDIEVTFAEGSVTAFEVKFLGGEDEDFRMILQSVAGLPAGGPVSPYAAINYLLFRAYEAAKQFSITSVNRSVVLIVEDLTWWRFRIQLSNRWIDWANPRFIGQDPTWDEFLKEQQKRYPGLPSDVAATLREVDAVWIVRETYGYQFQLEYKVDRRST